MMVLQAKHDGFSPKKIGWVEQVSVITLKKHKYICLLRIKLNENNSNAVTTVAVVSYLV